MHVITVLLASMKPSKLEASTKGSSVVLLFCSNAGTSKRHFGKAAFYVTQALLIKTIIADVYAHVMRILCIVLMCT